MVKNRSLKCFRTDKFWSQLKTASSTVYATRHYLSKYAVSDPARLARSRDGGNEISGNVYVHHTAIIKEGAKVGPNVTIGEGTIVHSGARIRDSIILDHVVISESTCIMNSIVSSLCTVKKWARVEGANVGVNPNDPTTGLIEKNLFSVEGTLEPNITIIGEGCDIAEETCILNSIVM